MEIKDLNQKRFSIWGATYYVQKIEENTLCMIVYEPYRDYKCKISAVGLTEENIEDELKKRCDEAEIYDVMHWSCD